MRGDGAAGVVALCDIKEGTQVVVLGVQSVPAQKVGNRKVMCEDAAALQRVCVCGVWPSTDSIGLIQPKGPKPAFMRASLSRLNTLAVVGVEALVPPICAQPQVLPLLSMQPASTQATVAAAATQHPYQQGGAVQEDVKVGCNGANVRVGTACDERDIVIVCVCEVPALLAAARCILVVPEALYRLAGGSTAVFRYVSTAVLW